MNIFDKLVGGRVLSELLLPNEACAMVSRNLHDRVDDLIIIILRHVNPIFHNNNTGYCPTT